MDNSKRVIQDPIKNRPRAMLILSDKDLSPFPRESNQRRWGLPTWGIVPGCGATWDLLSWWETRIGVNRGQLGIYKPMGMYHAS